MRAVWLTLLALGSVSACAAETPPIERPELVAESQPAPTVRQEEAAPLIAKASDSSEPPSVTAKIHKPYDTTKRTEERAARVAQLRQQTPVPVRFSGLDQANAVFGGEVTFSAPECFGDAVQGGLVICNLPRFSQYTINQNPKKFDAAGPYSTWAFIGLDRDAGSKLSMNYTFNFHGGPRAKMSLEFDVAKRDWDISRIDGLPKNMVSEYTPEELARIRRASARKKIGFASNSQEVGFYNGFISPIPSDFTKTTNFGAQRILNGEPKRPHYGVDLAAPKGTPIIAPADGVVSLADDDMYFEGALIMIDHGKGLISYYLHMEDVMVEDGQTVKRGEQIATVGSKGRSTGPHLCWRLKWHGRNLDPELLTKWTERAQTNR